MKEIFIAVDEKGFQCLVRGGKLIVIDHKNKVKSTIILKDIGFDVMYNAIERVENGEEKIYEDLTVEIEDR